MRRVRQSGRQARPSVDALCKLKFHVVRGILATLLRESTMATAALAEELMQECAYAGNMAMRWSDKEGSHIRMSMDNLSCCGRNFRKPEQRPAGSTFSNNHDTICNSG